MKSPLFPLFTRRASTLIISLWALFLLSTVVLTWALWVDDRLTQTHEESLSLEAYALAYSGLTIALHPATTPLTPALHESREEEQRSFTAAIRGEGGKLNLSYLLQNENPTRIEVLKNYLALRGVDLRERDILLDCLLDWIDADNVRRLNGAEEEGQYKPSNKPMTSLDELPLVRHSQFLTSRHPEWREDFTLLSQGPLDLKYASEELIALIPGIGDMRAQQFVRVRRGADQLEETEDDPVFDSIEALVGALGLTLEQYQALGDLVTYDDPTIRIVSEGIAGEVHRQIEVVARRVEGQPPRILMWTEK